mmetsp:Transcript_6273/g.13596  ORF Transcript_6273/g.13596 Transcript_6273/m.13596 type:complete len:126 (-) Transcript_6273:211-588(-)
MCVKGVKLSPECRPGISASITRPRPDELESMADLFPESDITSGSTSIAPKQVENPVFKECNDTRSFFDPETAAQDAAKIMTTPGMGLKRAEMRVKLENIPESPIFSDEGNGFFSNFFARIAAMCS